MPAMPYPPSHELQHLHQPPPPPISPATSARVTDPRTPAQGMTSQGWTHSAPGLGGGARSTALCPKAGASLPPQGFSSFGPEVEGPLPLLQVWMWALSSLRWPPSCPVPAAVFSALSSGGLAQCPLPPPPCEADDSPGYSEILAGSA